MVYKPQTFHGVDVNENASAFNETAVAEALARAGTLDASNVSVTSVGETLVLQGTVSYPQEVAEAGDIAARTASGSRIENLVQATGHDNIARR
jgi:Flp pilus assembly secretin CpaC